MTILPKILLEKDQDEKPGPSSSEGNSNTRYAPPSPPSPGAWSGSSSSSQRDKPYLSEPWEVERRDCGRRRRRVQVARAAPRSPVDNNRERKNSDDEYDAASAYDYHKEKTYEKRMKEKKGFVIRRMVEDGACLFRAVADQIYGDQEMHGTVRTKCMDYMLKNRDYFSQFVTEDYITYINRKRQDACYGNQLEMQAMSEMFGRPLEVYIYSLDPMKTLKCDDIKTDSPPIRLSYHRSCHYNSVRDPHEASVGVGLGLPGFKPGLADQQQMQQGLSQSETDYIERIMMQDKLACSDLEATGDALTAAITRESYMEWVKANQAPSSSIAGTSDEVPGSSRSSCPTPPHSSRAMPLMISGEPSASSSSASSSQQLPAYLPDKDDEYDEEKMLEAAIALSRAEYINKLNKEPPS